MNKKVIVWALYDDGNMCYYQSLKDNENLEVYPVGINDIKDIENYKRIDLSLNNLNLLKELKSQLPKPNIILASPPCESWSRADCSLAIWDDINNEYWRVHNFQYYKDKQTTKNKRRNFMKKEINRVIGESTAGATKLIIDYFKPDVWVIENPYQSHIWKFLINHHGLDGILNSTYYSNYDQSYSLKPTKFFSNITLNLLRNSSIRGNSKYYTYGNYNQRSNIPTKLILDIVNSSTNFINSQKEQICH